MEPIQSLETQLEILQRDFDASFARPVALGATTLEQLLAIRVGSDAYALRLAEVGALEADRAITPLPSHNAELLGVAGLRGVIVAVYDLASLLGQQRAEAPRWLCLAQGSRVAFAFGAFEGQLRVEHTRSSPVEQRSHPALSALVRSGDISRPVVDLPSLVLGLEARGRSGASKESG
jgi:chemotaxis signal transduction protein